MKNKYSNKTLSEKLDIVDKGIDSDLDILIKDEYWMVRANIVKPKNRHLS